jgi:hypothetical protein
MYRGTEGTHHHGSDQVARDRSGGLHRKQEDQHRGHECAASRASYSDEQADDGAAENDVWIHVYGTSESGCLKGGAD